jgi:hypothetical protein
MKLHLLVILSTIVIVGCAAPTIKSTKKIPLNSLGTLAVLSFDGHNGHQFADHITQELILRGARVVERAKVHSVLREQRLSVQDIAKGTINYENLGGLLGVETVIVGSVSPIYVYASGAPSGKVSTASLRLIRINDGIIIGSVTYSANTELLAGSMLYPKCAEKIVSKIISSP